MPDDDYTGRPDPGSPFSGSYTLFYYENVLAAARWYKEVVGLDQVKTVGSNIIFRLTATSYLGLIDYEHGSQKPIAGRNKGAILSIEQNNLEDLLARLTASGDATLCSGIVLGIGGFTEEFKIYDPEDYTIEFFRWVEPVGSPVDALHFAR